VSLRAQRPLSAAHVKLTTPAFTLSSSLFYSFQLLFLSLVRDILIPTTATPIPPWESWSKSKYQTSNHTKAIKPSALSTTSRRSSVPMAQVRPSPFHLCANETGKSNLMDAISFVLGIKSSQLRSSQLRDLIYRGRILKESNGINGRDEDGEYDDDDELTQTQTQRTNGEEEERGPRRAWVMAVYKEDNGREIRYKRTYFPSPFFDACVEDGVLICLGLHLAAGASIGLIQRL